MPGTVISAASTPNVDREVTLTELEGLVRISLRTLPDGLVTRITNLSPVDMQSLLPSGEGATIAPQGALDLGGPPAAAIGTGPAAPLCLRLVAQTVALTLTITETEPGPQRRILTQALVGP